MDDILGGMGMKAQAVKDYYKDHGLPNTLDKRVEEMRKDLHNRVRTFSQYVTVQYLFLVSFSNKDNNSKTTSSVLST